MAAWRKRRTNDSSMCSTMAAPVRGGGDIKLVRRVLHRSRLPAWVILSQTMQLLLLFVATTTTTLVYATNELSKDASQSSLSHLPFAQSIMPLSPSPPPPQPSTTTLTSTFTGVNPTTNQNWPQQTTTTNNQLQQQTTVKDKHLDTIALETIPQTLPTSSEAEAAAAAAIEQSVQLMSNAKNGKLWKVVKKRIRSRADWDQFSSTNDKTAKLLSLWQNQQNQLADSNERTKSSVNGAKMVCLHMLPASKTLKQEEQFNLIRKCYPIEQIKTNGLAIQNDEQTSETPIKKDTSLMLPSPSALYSPPIIASKQLLARSPLMASPASTLDWYLKMSLTGTNSNNNNDNQTQKEQMVIDNKEEKQSKIEIELLRPDMEFTAASSTNNITTQTPPNNEFTNNISSTSVPAVTDTASSSGSTVENYLNLFEYQIAAKNSDTANHDPTITTSVKPIVDERMDQSSSEYISIVTNLNTPTNSISDESLTKSTPIEENSVDKMVGVKDLWQVNRRKKQLKEMTMASKYGNAASWTAPSSVQSNDTTADEQSSSPQSRKIPKLLLPKVNRPMMYRIDGYVPKPSLHRLNPKKVPSQQTLDTSQVNKSGRVNTSGAKKKNRMQKNKQKSQKLYQNQPNQYQRHQRDRHQDEYDEEDETAEHDEIEVSESISSHHRHRHSNTANNMGHETNSLVSPEGGLSNKKRKSKSKQYSWMGSLSSVPRTNFECSIDGIYPDVETGCQVWHVCQNGKMHSFLCPAGTIFNAKNRVCDWRYNTRCG